MAGRPAPPTTTSNVTDPMPQKKKAEKKIKENQSSPLVKKAGKPKRLFTQTVYHDWCKACGICIAFCPKKVFDREDKGHPVIARPDACIGCRFCEQHCPDFAITIGDRTPRRRKNDDD